MASQEFRDAVAGMISIGLTNAEIARAFNVDLRTLIKWRVDDREFNKLFRARPHENQTDRVERALYECAVGYEYDEVKLYKLDKIDPDTKLKTGEKYIHEHVVTKQAPPDVKAALRWLEAHRPDIWRSTSMPDLQINVSPEEKVMTIIDGLASAVKSTPKMIESDDD